MTSETSATRTRRRTFDPNLPVVTVVTVVYNRKDAVRKTLESVVRQRYSNLEYIIVDGGSTDGTVDVIRAYEDKIDLWISEPDKGIYDAMNKGIRLASGDWINFMNVGDLFANDDTVSLFATLDVRHADIVYGHALIDYGSFQTKYKIHALDQMWKRSPFCHQATFSRVQLMKEYQFDRTYKLGADYDFFFRAYKAGKKFLYIDTVICMFEGDQGASKKHFIAAMRELFRSSLTHDYQASHWLYSKLYMLYLQGVLGVKGMLGEKFVFRAKQIFQRQK
jgi:glycosyltransferase involved in cell wall biosynthesis